MPGTSRLLRLRRPPITCGGDRSPSPTRWVVTSTPLHFDPFHLLFQISSPMELPFLISSLLLLWFRSLTIVSGAGTAKGSKSSKGYRESKSLWLASNPSKRWGEAFFLLYTPVVFTLCLGIIVPYKLYEVWFGERSDFVWRSCDLCFILFLFLFIILVLKLVCDGRDSWSWSI